MRGENGTVRRYRYGSIALNIVMAEPRRRGGRHCAGIPGSDTGEEEAARAFLATNGIRGADREPKSERVPPLKEETPGYLEFMLFTHVFAGRTPTLSVLRRASILRCLHRRDPPRSIVFEPRQRLFFRKLPLRSRTESFDRLCGLNCYSEDEYRRNFNRLCCRVSI